MLFSIKIIFQNNFRMYKNNFVKFGQKNYFFYYCYSTATVPPTVRILTVAIVHMTVTIVNLTVTTVPLQYFPECLYIIPNLFWRASIAHIAHPKLSKAPKSSQANLQEFQDSQRFIVHLPKSHKARGEKEIVKPNPIFSIQIEVTIYLFI